MEIHQLRYFLAVAQTGSFTAAAAQCHVSQPSLSSQIAKLERELGGPLIERGRGGARLTARGRVLRPRAVDTLQQLERARAELQELDGLRSGRVALGCLPTTGAHLLPTLLGAFRSEHPGIEVQLREESSPGLAAALHNYEIDIAIIDEAGVDESMAAEPLFTESLLIALPPDHPLAARHTERGEVELGALRDEAFILMKEGHGFSRIVLQALQAAGVQPDIVYRSAEIETVQGLVGAGLGVSLVPRMVRKAWGISYLRIAPPSPSRTLLIACRDFAALSPAAQALRVTAVEHLGGYGDR
ncbi:LysR family transcriptional regulator [Spirochaeta africana]|uniref:Transcriptional regulator n=1 Tax=Spirochaeta africana (strain ATCC 700263 / DSM 8902 / Z-7692) TaxID=889378 RepID=H9ULI2_SPIAZ|nr:LysR family transcriptional regulator [Spirochaeta africana]AFG38375.1 transcriptional regulator [Spirochaeta africana DSM 8902]